MHTMNRYSKLLALLFTLCIIFAGCSRPETETQEVQRPVEQVKSEQPQEAKQTPAPTESAPASLEEMPATTEMPDTTLQEKVDSLYQSAAQYGGTWSIGAIAPGEVVCVSANRRAMPSASLIKLYVAACVQRDREKLAALEQYPGETDALFSKMLSQSDNDATNTLTRRLGGGDAIAGMGVVNAYCKEQGYNDTTMGRLMLDFSSQTDNYTSVADCCAFLRGVLDGKVPGASNILTALKKQERTEKIPAGVPLGVQTANKTGELDTVENDAAIIWKGGRPYILCVMTDKLPNTAAAREHITQISTEMYRFFEG